MYLKNKRGQSTIEYILLVTAVIAVIIIFTQTSGSGLQGRLSNTLSEATNGMGTLSNALLNSRPLSNSLAPTTASAAASNRKTPV